MEEALQVVDAYMAGVHDALDASLTPASRPPLDRVRGFFDLVAQSYATEGYLGCLIGGLGQELSGASPVFAERITGCLSYIADRLAVTLEEARRAGDLPSDTDTHALASRLVNSFGGDAAR